MDKWGVVDLAARGVSRSKIVKRVQDSGYFGEGGLLASLDKKSVQYEAGGVRVMTFWDKEYPESLKNINDPPVCLFYRGQLPADICQLIAVVGSRKISAAGRGAVYRIVPALVKDGFGIVSGLAYGTDTLVHRVCLGCGGIALAVLPTSLDRIYPKENRDLAEEVVENGGCLISEYPMGTGIKREHFLERNRIMVGLSKLLVVIEARRFSGTTASANFALDQGKEVYVATDERGVPIGEGARELVEDGALPLTSGSVLVGDF